MIREFLWRIVAWIVTREPVLERLLARAAHTPYEHIYGKCGDMYMGRWWVCNPQPEDDDNDDRSWWRRLLPSWRLHWIRRPDGDRHCHDHPRESRTIVLDGWYEEERLVRQVPSGVSFYPSFHDDGIVRAGFRRERGYTGRLPIGVFHRISKVADGGCWTLFITWKKQTDWGFNVDGVKVSHGEYFALGATQ